MVGPMRSYTAVAGFWRIDAIDVDDMLAVTEGGRAYTAGEISSLLKSAGLRKVSREKPDPRGVGIVAGRA